MSRTITHAELKYNNGSRFKMLYVCGAHITTNDSNTSSALIQTPQAVILWAGTG